MADYGGFLDDLAGRLSKRGFSITCDVGFSSTDKAAPGKYKVDIMAAKGELSFLKGNWARYIVLTTMDLPTPDVVIVFSKYSFVYALTSSRTFLPRFTPHRAVRIVVPVVVSHTLSEEM